MRFMVAVDIHKHCAQRVVDEAASWASRMGATLDIGFVDEYEYSAYLIRDTYVRGLVTEQWERVREANQHALNALVDAVPEGVRGEIRYLQGRAHDALLEASEDYDGVFVATHGRTGLTHVFLGSVAERVVRRATVPVVVLRVPDDAAADTADAANVSGGAS